MTESNIAEIHIPLKSRKYLVERLQKSISDIIKEQGDSEIVKSLHSQTFRMLFCSFAAIAQIHSPEA